MGENLAQLRQMLPMTQLDTVADAEYLLAHAAILKDEGPIVLRPGYQIAIESALKTDATKTCVVERYFGCPYDLVVPTGKSVLLLAAQDGQLHPLIGKLIIPGILNVVGKSFDGRISAIHVKVKSKS